MTFRLLVRTLMARPVRTLVLSAGFGFGIAVMAVLLGVGQVILEQAQAPDLVGGGDLVVEGAAGRVTRFRYLLESVIEEEPLEGLVEAASPSRSRSLFLLRDGEPIPVLVKGGIPSLERRLGDPETAEVSGWKDTPEDRRWLNPAPGELLRDMDRFHPVPRGTPWSGSWAEWLYFNGADASGSARFYLTFLVGEPEEGGATRPAWVRFQWEANGATANYYDEGTVEESELLSGGPDIRIGDSRVRLVDRTYQISLDLVDQEGRPALTGRLELQAPRGGSVPPLELRGRDGWVSGYVVPVLSGRLRGRISGPSGVVELAGDGYHDHNWGFWKDVTWQWGQVGWEDVSFVYGKVRPPREAADPERVPGFLMATGPEGPLGFAQGISIREKDGPEGYPEKMEIQARGAGLDLRMELGITDAVRSEQTGSMGMGGQPVVFYQMRARYRVEGTMGGKPVEFEAPGAAETFRVR